MNKQDVVQFFDRLAPQWDADLIRHDDVIANILDNAGVKAVLVGWTVALDPEDLPEDVRPDAVLERPEDLLSLAESF